MPALAMSFCAQPDENRHQYVFPARLCKHAAQIVSLCQEPAVGVNVNVDMCRMGLQLQRTATPEVPERFMEHQHQRASALELGPEWGIRSPGGALLDELQPHR